MCSAKRSHPNKHGLRELQVQGETVNAKDEPRSPTDTAIDSKRHCALEVQGCQSVSSMYHSVAQIGGTQRDRPCPSEVFWGILGTDRRRSLHKSIGAKPWVMDKDEGKRENILYNM